MISWTNKTGLKDTYVLYRAIEELNRKNVDFNSLSIEIWNEDEYYFAYCEYSQYCDIKQTHKLTLTWTEY